MHHLLEIACFSAEAAIIAEAGGAQRIELCKNYCVGGLTPDPESISGVKENCSIPVHVIIRPRAGNFVYSKNEFFQIREAIEICSKLKVDGVVFGALNQQNEIDIPACKSLINAAGNMSVTFHRAIDNCINLERGIEDLIQLGIKRVLTSGGKPTALEGLQTITSLQKNYGNQIVIMPGGGVRASNVLKIARESGCTEFHSAAMKVGSELPSRNEIARLHHALNER